MAQTIDELLRHADIAMYHVKAQGKNGYSFYDDSMLDVSYQKIALEQSLRRALEQDELEMYYQPQVDSLSGEVVGAEALMRWNHPERGLLTAGEFFAVRRRKWFDDPDQRLDAGSSLSRSSAMEFERRNGSGSR